MEKLTKIKGVYKGPSTMPTYIKGFRNFVAVFCISISLFGCDKKVSPQAVTSQVVANKNMSCAQDTSLKELEGVWSDEKFITTLKDTRSWSDASKAQTSWVSSIIIENEKIFYTWSWHEFSNSGERNDVCVKKDGEKIWFPRFNSAEFDGPFVKIGSGDSEERLYLAQFWSGCYKSEQSEKWCFSKNGISTDGKYLSTRLRKDLSETPNYGTIFDIDGQKPPFMIFVPQNDGGWLVYKDDWASSEGYIPVKVGVDTPWRRLMKEQ